MQALCSELKVGSRISLLRPQADFVTATVRCDNQGSEQALVLRKQHP